VSRKLRTVLLIGSLDTKGEEYAYAREQLRIKGLTTHVMDFGIMGEPSFPADISAADVAEAGGASLESIRSRRDRADAMEVMTRGAAKLTRDMHDKGHFHGVLGMAGGGGTALISAAMRTLPVGVPKLLLSTMASGDVRPYVDVKDITMMYSVVDVAGLNPISRQLIDNCVGAISGMLEGSRASQARQRRPLIAASMFGVTTPCVAEARNRLEEKGYEVVTFHATGTGGRAMEGLIDDGFFEGVLDVTTTEWCDEVVGGVLSAGPDRLGAAARKGIPQVVSVGALDMVNFGAMDSLPDRFRGRKLYKHTPAVTLMRTTPDECTEIGRRIAAQLNKSTGPVVLMLPLKGVSMIDEAGGPFFDADADKALFDSLRMHCGKQVKVREFDLHVNDTEFAHALADELLALLST
jgi:uncharacterized protein (UPF0261 family)